MAFSDLFDLDAIAGPSTKPKQHLNPNKFLTLDDWAANGCVTPDGFWLRTNGKTHTYTDGKVQACTLEWNINNVNDNNSKFRLMKYTIPTWAKQANCSTEYLIAAILTSKKYRDTVVGEFVKNTYNIDL